MSDEMIAMDSFDEAIQHYGTLRKSGRYPWGSGDNGYQKHRDFLGDIQNYKKQGFTPHEIAKAMLGPDGTDAEIRRLVTNSRKIVRTENIDMARKLAEKQMSNVAIAQRLGIPEATVRSYLKEDADQRAEKFNTVKDFLKERADETGYLDVGAGTEHYLGISDTRKKAILGALEDEGYTVHRISVPQAGTDKETNFVVLTKPGTTYGDVWKNIDKIEPPKGYSEDHGATIIPIKPPVSISSKRVGVRYGDEGGSDKDGVIELRRGVDDISLGNARYAQVRIAVDDSHYLKGMAMYSDNLPDGVDILFNTNKKSTGNKLDAMKPLKKNKDTGEVDEDMPFGSIVRQKTYVDVDGKKKQSVLNIVGTFKKDDDGNDISISGEEGNWNTWSKNFSSQMLSKQSVPLAKQQLDLTYRTKLDEFDEISKLTNPEIKKKLLAEFADGVDSSAVHLKAAGLPRTRSQVILPINSLKDDEIFAPNFKNGETVVLVRHPHGGTFEIPQLKVNNNNREAKRVIPQAKDAVGINSRVAARLSGADFDGDTVLVIPNNQGRIRTSTPLAGLKDFDPQKAYAGYDGMRTIDGGTYNAKTKKIDYGGKSPDKGAKQLEMGKISNLITDMTLQGANHNEIARAVRHSMVVIDAEKHSLDFKRSFRDNNIAELKERYQGAKDGGASTIISRAKSTVHPNERKDGPIDPDTGEKTYIYTERKYKEGPVNPKTGKKTRIYSDNPEYDSLPGKVHNVTSKRKSTLMAETKDARDLISEANTPMENVYANHANKLKALANNARKEALAVKPIKQNASAKAMYEKEVESLKTKLRIAQMNAPLERKAQVIADTIVKQKVQANPDLDASELKKIKALALDAGRTRAGANKQRIVFTDREWEAIQNRALSSNMISQVLQHANADDVKARATPRTNRTVMTDTKIRRAKALLASGYNQSEIADTIGVPLSTLYSAIN